MLTVQQAFLLRYVKDYAADHDGASPSYTEMMAATDLASKSGVARLLRGLEERGFIRRHPRAVRGIEVIDRPTRAVAPTDLHAIAAQIVTYAGPEAAKLRSCAVPADMILALKEAL